MVVLLCAIICIAFAIITAIANKEDYVGTEVLSGVISCLAGLAVIVMLIVLFVEHSTIDAKVAEKEETYKAITYKVESGTCRDELGLLSKEVIDEVQEWNKDIVYHQNVQDDFWIGIFYPDVYDRFETIDYTKYAK